MDSIHEIQHEEGEDEQHSFTTDEMAELSSEPDEEETENNQPKEEEEAQNQ